MQKKKEKIECKVRVIGSGPTHLESSMWEVEAGELGLQDQPWPHTISKVSLGHLRTCQVQKEGKQGSKGDWGLGWARRLGGREGGRDKLRHPKNILASATNVLESTKVQENTGVKS